MQSELVKELQDWFSLTILGGTSMQFWEPVGHAILTDDYIRLVPDQQSKSGGIWNSLVSYM